MLIMPLQITRQNLKIKDLYRTNPTVCFIRERDTKSKFYLYVITCKILFIRFAPDDSIKKLTVGFSENFHF